MERRYFDVFIYQPGDTFFLSDEIPDLEKSYWEYGISHHVDFSPSLFGIKLWKLWQLEFWLRTRLDVWKTKLEDKLYLRKLNKAFDRIH